MKPTRQFTFAWQGVNKQGERCHGEQISHDSAAVKTILLRQNISPLTIRKKLTSILHNQKINFKDITLFTRQMATLLTAGIPIIKALEMIVHTQAKATCKQLILQLKIDITAGYSINEALKQHPHYFNTIFCNLVSAGEKSGKLEQIFERIAQQREKFTLLKSNINQALLYPTTILIIAILICSGLLIFVVPQFALLFQSFGAELPLATRIVMRLGNILQDYSWVIISLLFSLGFSIKTMKQKSLAVTYFFDRWQLKSPIFGILLQNAIIAGFSQTLATLFAAGIPLIEALHTVASTTGNTLYSQAIQQISKTVASGQTLTKAIQQTHLFPPLVTQLIHIGEESGALEKMLIKIAYIYENEVNNSVESLTTLLEPLIMVILGALVGSLVIAMYLPIFKLGSVIH